MRIRRFIAVIAAILAASALTCCTSLSLNGSDILAPPRASGSRAEIQRIIEEDAGGSCTLISPSFGEYRSGIIMYDLNKDGSEEAVALYSTSASARLLVAASHGAGYRRTDSCELNSANVSGVSFADINADGTDEIIIACDTGSPIAKLSVYFISDKITYEDIAEGFSGYLTGDFDGNTAADILTFIPVKVEATAKALLTVYSDGAFTEKSSCETDPEIAAYARLSCGSVDGTLNGAFIDGVNEDGEFTTQLIYYDPTAHSLINPLIIYTGYDKTVRTAKILCADYDGDGITEIPICKPMAHTKDEELSKICTAVEWSRYDLKQMTAEPVSEAVLCEPMGFILSVKPGTLDSCTARCEDKSSMTLYRIKENDVKSVIGKPVLTVKYYDKGAFDSAAIPEAVIRESGTGVYTCVLSDDSGYTYDEINKSFTLTEDM